MCYIHDGRLTTDRLCVPCAWRIRAAISIVVAIVAIVIWAWAWPALASDDGGVMLTVVLRTGDPAPWDGFLVTRERLDTATVALEVERAPCAPCPETPFPWAVCGSIALGAFGIGVGSGALTGSR